MRARRGARILPLGSWMAGTILVVTALAYWDAARESAAALDDFAREQTTLAESVGAAVSVRVSTLPANARGNAAEAFVGVRAIEEPGIRRLLLLRPGIAGLLTTDGHVVKNARVEKAAAHGGSAVRLTREEAAALALPRRTAIAGVSTFDGAGGTWGVVVAATARRERDREMRAIYRLLFSVLVASSLVLAFGGLALRKQRKELELESELAITQLERERDAQLVQIDKLATLGALASGIAHEVSTPLGVILGRAEQLLPRAPDERMKRHIESILEQGNRISSVVRGFLNLVRGDAPALEQTDPAEVTRACTELVEHRFSNAGVTLAVNQSHELPFIACETPLLEQAVINLLLNACDACEPGGTVTLDVRSGEGRVAFVVTDDGSGITEEAAARAVEPFFTTKPAGKGTGLGLAIANEIAKNHGGRLTIGPRTPASGELYRSRGTRASIELPIPERTTRE